MKTSNPTTGNVPKKSWLFPVGIAIVALSSVVVVSCFHDDDPTVTLAQDDAFLPLEPAPLNVQGTALYCDPATVTPVSTVAATLKVEAPDSIPAMNISFDEPNESFNNHNAANNLKQLSAVVLAETPDGEDAVDDEGALIGDVHPLIISYGEQVIGGYEPGDGSADVGDPDNIDDIFTSLSLDGGKSWKKVNISGTAKDLDTGMIKSSSIVTWDGVRIPYPGHSHKPTMHVQGNNILVAWNDKYCPSGNPFDLDLEADPDADYYKVNGSQGTVDYGGIQALPNDKFVYEVPYSCVWTARGVFDPNDVDSDGILEIEWRKAQQLTSGTRDSNKIWIAPAEVGFAITWQEDPDGLRPGKGEGPGAGWSGATTNHGADIWYTYITMEDFDDVCLEFDADGVCTTSTDDPVAIAALDVKPKPAINFKYPVRITNNDSCTPDDTKVYCADHCASTVSVESNNSSGATITRCVQNDLDYMTPDDTIDPIAAVLDGDTGASRPAMKILKTNAAEPEFVTILAYEETKGLAESSPADQGDTDTEIALEGKSVYFESFFWDQPVEVSAGRVVNLRVPEVTDVSDDGVVTTSELMVYENARRVVIMPQVDPCETQDGDPTFALLYKQGYDTQGGPSDMFVRVNYGFTYDNFGLLDNREATNVSSHDNENVNGDGLVIWDETWLDTQSSETPFDNTFSPRGWLRGGEVYTGFEYSPLWRATAQGTVPNNFWIHRYVDSTWQGPMQISIVTGAQTSTLDPRFIPTPKGSNTTLASDQSNPDVIFLGYGTFNMDTGEEEDLFYTRSTDKGATWEYCGDSNCDTQVVTDAGLDGIPATDDDPAVRLAKLAHRADAHEMELQGMASPDGTIFMGAWLRETASVVNNHQDGLESEFGRVNYDLAE